MTIARFSAWIWVPGFLLAVAGFCPRGNAQTSGQEAGKYLYIQREVVKPGQRPAYAQSQEAMVRAQANGNASQHYIALSSITGEARMLFVSDYGSLQEMETRHQAMPKTMWPLLERLNEPNGGRLSSAAGSMWMRRDDLSTNVQAPGAGTRFIEVSQYVVKPGKAHEFEDMAKMYVAAAKGRPVFHWTVYELMYGQMSGPTFIVLTSDKNLGDIDAAVAGTKEFMTAMGEDGQKKVADMEADSVETEMTNLYVISPDLSYPPQDVVAQEPAFWAPQEAAGADGQH